MKKQHAVGEKRQLGKISDFYWKMDFEFRRLIVALSTRAELRAVEEFCNSFFL